jgi:hypothetical protein
MCPFAHVGHNLIGISPASCLIPPLERHDKLHATCDSNWNGSVCSGTRESCCIAELEDPMAAAKKAPVSHSRFRAAHEPATGARLTLRFPFVGFGVFY